MGKWGLQAIIAHHKGVEKLDDMFLRLPSMGSYHHGITRLALACCEAIEKSGRELTPEVLGETVKLNRNLEYEIYVQVPYKPIGAIRLPELKALPEPEIEGAQDDLGVKVENGKVIVSSLDVAKAFGKNHRHVIRDIENLDCSEDFRRPNFGLTSRIVAMPNNATRQEKYYNMTRDGFTFLAMGYTGAKAAAFKEAYIKRFNEMEDALRGKTAVPALPEKASASSSEKLYTPEEAAEELLLVGYRSFYALMVKLGFFVKLSNRMYVPKPEYVRQGLFDIHNRQTHKHRRPLVTQAGIVFLRERLKQQAISA